MILKVKKLKEEAVLPERKTPVLHRKLRWSRGIWLYSPRGWRLKFRKVVQA